MSAILSCHHLTKRFRSGPSDITVLDDVSFNLEEGETCAIIGPSGSGKTTFLGLCAGLDRPTSGCVTLCQNELAALSEDNLSQLRASSVGFVFQSFQLIPTLTALENVLIPLELCGVWNKESGKELLERVGLKDRLHHLPSQLSGGEQQRVALARAFVNKPKILFADEPTGNLDFENAEIAIRCMFDLNKEFKTALLLITHEAEIASRLSRRITLRAGRLVP